MKDESGVIFDGVDVKGIDPLSKTPLIGKKTHGTGAAGNRLANFLKAKTRQEKQDRIDKGEKSTYALPEMRTSKAGNKLVKKIEENDKLSQFQKDKMLREKVLNNKSVSEKKWTKRRLSPSDVQR